MPLIRRGGAKQIEANRIFHVSRIEICHVLNTMAWHVIENVICQIAVRINDGDPVPGFNVLQNQIAEQGGFSRSTFADGVKVMTAVVVRKSKGQFLPPHFAHP